jgi:DMATS type aromatic prenyltransferase
MVGACVNVAELSLREYTSAQLRNLCEVAGFDTTDNTPDELLRELLGTAGERSLSEPPPWPSDISDDATPVEFSIAFDASGERAVRVLGETIAERPSKSANMGAALQFFDSLSDRFQLSVNQFKTVRDLFLPEQPQGKFSLWYSFILRPDSSPKIKIYFNPGVRGAEQAPELVAEGLSRLGLDNAYRIATEHALLRGNLDKFTFFAIDLDDKPSSRVKIYISHHAAELKDVERAASAVPGVDPKQVRDFCSLIGGGSSGPFTGLPLLSSYSFVESDADHPSNYSIYFPIRGHVTDDAAARALVIQLMKLYDFDPTELDHALDAVSRRPLRDGVGLIAYVSLRLGKQSGITVYLSSEAYAVAPPREGFALAETTAARSSSLSI